MLFSILLNSCGNTSTSALSSSSTTTTTTGSTASSFVTCIGYGCAIAPEYLQLKILNNDPVTYMSDSGSVTETTVDISGSCNVAGYSDHSISYTIYDNNNVSKGSGSNYKCSELGRFSFSIDTSALTATYQLTVQLLANGNVSNPKLQNISRVTLTPRSSSTTLP